MRLPLTLLDADSESRSRFPFVVSVAVHLPPRDVMAEMRELARIANAMHAGGLTAWRERNTLPGVECHPPIPAAASGVPPFSQKGGT